MPIRYAWNWLKLSWLINHINWTLTLIIFFSVKSDNLVELKNHDVSLCWITEDPYALLGEFSHIFPWMEIRPHPPGSGVKHEPFYVAIITPAPRRHQETLPKWKQGKLHNWMNCWTVWNVVDICFLFCFFLFCFFSRCYVVVVVVVAAAETRHAAAVLTRDIQGQFFWWHVGTPRSQKPPEMSRNKQMPLSQKILSRDNSRWYDSWSLISYDWGIYEHE